MISRQIAVRPAVRPVIRPAIHPPRRRVRSWLAHRLRAHPADAGMSTAEYAVGTIAAVAFAMALYRVVSSDMVRSALTDIVRHARNVSI